MPPRKTGSQRRKEQSLIRAERNASASFYGPGGDPAGTGSGQAQQKPPTTAEPGAKPTDKSLKSQDTPKNGITIGSKTKPVKSREKVPDNLRYPDKAIHKDTDYLRIEILKYKGADFTDQTDFLVKGVNRASTNIKKTIGTIILPIPQNIKDLNAAGWGEDSLNSMSAYVASAAGGVMFNEGGFVGNLINAALQTGQDAAAVATDGTGQKAIQSQFTAAAANIAGANTSAAGLLARATGAILNPNKELLFNGVSLRDFSFVFDLAPRNKPEADKVLSIIRTLKINMAPTTSDIELTRNGESITGKGLFLKSPNVFRLTYMTGSTEHQFLNKFKLMALTNMSVNYTGSGTYMTYGDENKTPVHMQMMLNFKELDPVYSEDYDGVGGVGY